MILNLLSRVTSALDDNDIQYMLSGGLALNNYSIPRMTMDIDIVVELNGLNIEQFLTAFSDNFYIDEETVRQETKRKGMFNIIDHQSGFKIDFILRKNTEYRISEFQRRQKTKINDLEIWVVSMEDLVISKIEWIQTYQSDKHIEDIKSLMANPEIDKDYVNDWCKKLNLKTFNLI